VKKSREVTPSKPPCQSHATQQGIAGSLTIWVMKPFNNTVGINPQRRTLCQWLGTSLGASLGASTVAGAGLLASQAATAQKTPPDASRYSRTQRSADGIGKAYMGREIAGVMGWQGAAWLEREEREQEERGDLLLRELGLKPGMTVADVGAGTGYYARRMAPLVGSTGTVYAVDVQPEMIQMLTDLAKKAGLANIKPVLGALDNVKLADSSIDLAIMVDVYHELEFPFEVMQSLVRAVKPGGRVVFVEYRAEDPRVPIKALHKMSEAQVRKEAAPHALVYERTASTLPWQHVVIFRKSA
jgi:SAM-dependent methyltransferase